MNAYANFGNGVESNTYFPFVQRKCDCGETAKISGSCEGCEKEKLTGLQRKFKIGTADDHYEREADRIADQVLNSSNAPEASDVPLKISRNMSSGARAITSSPASVENVLSSSGRPLDTPIRQDMEERFGQDFSRVRIHTDSSAARSASDIDARAYTAGHQIVFNTGQYSPNNNAGKQLLAHELTHVLQQRGSQDVLAKSPLIQRSCAGKTRWNCTGRCTAASGRRGVCQWGGIKYGCRCRDTSGDAPPPMGREMVSLPTWLAMLLSAAAIALIAACFATGACEFGLVVAGLGAAAAAAVIAILEAAGIRDTGADQTA